MKKQVAITIRGIALVVATTMLWLRVRSLESAKHNDKTTNVGVPWDVERAMIGGADKNAPVREEMNHVEISPTPSQPKLNLDFLNRESDSN